MNLIKRDRPALDLWEAFDGLRGEMDRALDLFRVPDAAGLLDRSMAPALDIIEGNEEYLIRADLPGVEKKELEISVTGTVLSHQGRAQGREEVRFRQELPQGDLVRILPADHRPATLGGRGQDLCRIGERGPHAPRAQARGSQAQDDRRIGEVRRVEP
jgi:HSP20 family protein